LQSYRYAYVRNQLFKIQFGKWPKSIICLLYRKFDIMDSMLQKLEKYADNLENIVQQRTAELIDEKQKMDMLLHRMLPPYTLIIIL